VIVENQSAGLLRAFQLFSKPAPLPAFEKKERNKSGSADKRKEQFAFFVAFIDCYKWETAFVAFRGRQLFQ